MPRPPVRRHKPNTKQSPSNARRVPSNTGLNSTPRVKLQQQLANKPIGQRPQDSDDSDRLVTRTRHGRHQRNTEQIFASGGVAKGDTPGVFPTKQERRQRLRSETNEIVRRSRSKSTEKLHGKSSLSRSISVDMDKSNNQSTPAVETRVTTTASPQDLLPKSHPTPLGDKSVLGTLKPRRRQASILHTIDNNDSSIINPEDEEQFLPDDESTPLLNLRKDNTRPDTVQNATSSPGTISRKRKLGADEPVPLVDSTSSPLSSVPRSETPAASQSSLPIHSVETPSANVVDDDDEIMALPQSSSAESSPQKPKPPAPTKHKRTISVPTTEQLQSLMPSKRRKGNRERKALTEFDIPDDSEPNGADQIEDESTFLPQKRGSKPRNKKDASSRPVGSSTNKGKKGPIGTPNGKPKSKSRNTPLKPVTPRTPLPLTRNTNQENKAMSSLARSRHAQVSTPNAKSVRDGQDNSTLKRTTNTNTAKQSGGSHLRRSTRGAPPATVTTGAESDKENSSSLTSKSGTRQTRASRKRPLSSLALAPEPKSASRRSVIEVQASMEVDGVQPSIEEVDVDADADVMETQPDTAAVAVNEADTEAETEIVDRVSDSIVSDAGHGVNSIDAKVWKSKWGDIDDWDLEYEEVDISTGASSPLRVSAV